MPPSDRITPAIDLSPIARDSERRFEATGSDIRRALLTHAVPWLLLTYDQVRDRPLDSRDAFVLSLVDGRCTVEMILDMAGIPEDETMDILRKLLDLGVMELRGE